MVSIPKRRVWANDETQVAEPSTTLQDTGYAPLEQPYNEHHNWIWNSRDKGANRIIHDRNMATRFDAVISIGDQVSRNFQTYDAAHIYKAGRNAFVDNLLNAICVGWHYDTQRECVLLGKAITSNITRVRNDDEFNLLSESLVFTFNEASERPEAMVSEGDTLYVMTLGHSSGDAYFYRFSINPFNATPIWSTSDTGSFFKNRGRSCLCIAGDWLAYLRTNVEIDTGTDVIRMIRKSDAGAFRQGMGNILGVSGFYTGWSLVANADSLFYGAYNPTTVGAVKLGGADIANPNTANYPGGLWFGKDIGGTTPGGGVIVGAGDLIYDGELVHISTTNGLIASYDWEADIWTASGASNYRVSNALEDVAELEHAPFAYDGFNAWLLSELEGASGNDNNSIVTQVAVSNQTMDWSGQLLLDIPAVSQIPLGRPRPSARITHLPKMVVADNSLWIMDNTIAEPTVEPNFWRIRNLSERR
jgi:hypothetical protein